MHTDPFSCYPFSIDTFSIVLFPLSAVLGQTYSQIDDCWCSTGKSSGRVTGSDWHGRIVIDVNGNICCRNLERNNKVVYLGNKLKSWVDKRQSSPRNHPYLRRSRLIFWQRTTGSL